MLTILIECTILLRIECLNVRFSKHQKQPSGGVLSKGVLNIFAKFTEKYQNVRDAVFNLKFQPKRSTTLLKRDTGICAFLRFSQKF